MASTTCVNCGQKVDSSATRCPQCGGNPSVHAGEARSDPSTTGASLPELTSTVKHLRYQLVNAERTHKTMMLTEFMQHGSRAGGRRFRKRYDRSIAEIADTVVRFQRALKTLLAACAEPGVELPAFSDAEAEVMSAVEEYRDYLAATSDQELLDVIYARTSL